MTGSLYIDGIGGGAIAASAVQQADSTTQGVLIPRMTTAQRDAIAAPATGLLIYNTTTSALNIYIGGWVAVVGSGGGAPANAAYITQTADATLSAEQALSSLATGQMQVTTATGVITSRPNGVTSTATAAGTTTLTSASNRTQIFTGATTQTCVLPDATTLALGWEYLIRNTSTGAVTVNANGGGLVVTLAANQEARLICTNIGSAAGAWSVQAITGTGAEVHATSPTIATPTLTGFKQQLVFTINSVLSTGLYPLRLYNELGANRTISKVHCAVNTAPTGADIIVDILQNGTTIFTGGTNRPIIAAAANAGNTTTIDVPTWTSDNYLQLSIAQIGSTFAGADLTVTVVYAQ